VLGWRVRHSGTDAVVLAAESVSGLSARIVPTAPRQRVVQVMVVRYDRWFGLLLSALVASRHRRFVKGLLRDAMVRAGHPNGSDTVPPRPSV
jgi:hypothetical protein